MKCHKCWVILGIITYVWHMVAGLYSEVIYFLAEYVWFASIIFSVLAIYSGVVNAVKTEPEQRGAAIASAVIGGIVLLGLMISASSWLFMPEYALEPLM